MTAPIRPEHREAARALIHALASERLNEIGGTVGYYIELTGEQGEINEEAIAAVLAARDTALSAEYAAAVWALRRANGELEAWRNTADVEEWGGVAMRSTSEAIGRCSAVLSTPRARAVLKQGETT